MARMDAAMVQLRSDTESAPAGRCSEPVVFPVGTHVHNRKNYLFAGSDAGGERAAAIYTLVQTAKLNGLNLETYLQDILAKIAMGRPSIASTNWCPGV
jgi:hypothetical protein